VAPSVQRRKVWLMPTTRVPCSTWTVYFILYNGPPLPALKIAPSHGGSGPPSNTWFPGPTRALNPKGILISLAISAGLTIATDRQTDRQTDRRTEHATLSVTTGRIYERSTAMWPKETTINRKRQNHTRLVRSTPASSSFSAGQESSPPPCPCTRT